MEHELFSLYAESRRYSRYEARIRRFGQILGWVRRHWVMLALAGLLIAVAVVGFLLAVGSFTGSISCEDLIYGETPRCSVEVFLSDVRYQYAAAEGEAVWSDELPTLPGTYRIRAVSKNGFGQPKYSDSITFTLLPRELNVQIHSGTFVYGSFSTDIAEENTELTGLAGGDRAQLEYTMTQDDAENYAVAVKDVRICNSAGQDVTACYRISTTDGYFTMTPRPITVSAKDAQKVYDGEEWNLAEWALTEGALAENDTLRIAFSPAPATAGRHPLVPRCAVYNAAGEDVTSRYQINAVEGALTVLPRPITVQTGSASKGYDATPLTNSQWNVTDGAPIEGHTLVGTVTGSQTAAGQGSNTIDLKVIDAEGNDVSANYALSSEPGTLTVTPIILKFETDSRERVYNGNILTEDGCRLISGKVLKGHRLIYRTSSGQTNVGTSYNDLFVMVQDAAGNDVTSEGYAIEVDRGTLTVTPRPITISSGSAEKLYDGYPLTCWDYTVPQGTFEFGSNNELIRRTFFTGSQTEVGSSANTFTVQITNYEGQVTTFNYDITYIYGTLTVLENPYPPTQGGSGGTGSTGQGTGGGGTVGGGTVGGEGGTGGDIGGGVGGTGGGSTGGIGGIGMPGESVLIDYPDASVDIIYAYVEGLLNIKTPERIYFRNLSYGDYTGSGWVTAEPYWTSATSPLHYIGNTLGDDAVRNPWMKIHRINDCPALLPYFAPVYYTSNPSENDCYFIRDDLTYNMPVATGHTYEDLKHMTVNKTLAGEEKIYRSFVHEQYLQIPDTTKQALLEWAARHGIRADSPTLAEDIQSAIINAAEYDPYGVSYPQGVDVAVYFLTEAKEGICQHFATAATLMYRAFGIPARYTVGFVDTVQEGVVTNLTSQDGHAWVEIYVDGLGWVPMEVTGSSLSLDVKTELHIQACSVTKTYDGKGFEEYDLTQYTILAGSLRKGHRLEVTTATGRTAITPGDFVNRIERCVIYDENGKNVTSEYYNIHIYYGTLKILPRKITVTIGSASKVYDGQPLTCEDYWISQGSLAPDHELDVTIDSILWDPGTADNIPAKVRVLKEERGGSMVDYSICYEIIVIPGKLEITLPETDTDGA